MKLAPHRIAEARGDMSRPELARRLSRRDPLHLGTTSAQQIKRWEEGHHRMRFESETIVAIAAETGQPVSFFYSTDDEQAASDDEEAAQVEVTVTTYRGTPEMVAALMRQVEEIVNPAPVPV